MKKQHSLVIALFLSICVFVLDRVTKMWALAHAVDQVPVNEYLSCQLFFNRGVSWSFFHSSDDHVFTILSCIIALLIIGLLGYTIVRCVNRFSIVGEVLILAGAISNVIDRILYKGVVDFIMIHHHGFCWPVFNIADVAIVVGVCIMLFKGLTEQ